MSDKTSEIEQKTVDSTAISTESVERVPINDAGQSQMPVAGPSHIADGNPPQQPVAGASNEESVARIFKLDIDCFEELFEYLSLKDLFVLRQTCKQFKKLVDYYIKEYYPAIKLNYGIIKITDVNIEQFRLLDSNCVKLIKAVQMNTSDLSLEKIEIIKEILNYAELLEVSNFQIREHDFYEVFLKFLKIKCLIITNVDDTLVDGNTSWLQQHYPTLERIVLDDCNDGFYDGFEMTQLRTFFTINPNIQSFSTTLTFLWENRNWLLGCDIKIDQLEIESFYVEEIEEKFGLIGELYAQGFYQRLHYYAMVVTDDYMSLINTVPGLEKVHLAETDTVEIDLVVPATLKELCLSSSGYIKYPEVVANNLLNVERIFIALTKFDDILPYVRLSPKLKEIRVKQFRDGDRWKDGIIDLTKVLNQERKDLRGATKLRLYVNEDIFLKMKWNGIDTKRSLIEIKRDEECPRKAFSAFDSHCYPEN